MIYVQSEKGWTSIAFMEGCLSKRTFSLKEYGAHFDQRNCKCCGAVFFGLMRPRWRTCQLSSTVVEEWCFGLVLQLQNMGNELHFIPGYSWDKCDAQHLKLSPKLGHVTGQCSQTHQQNDICMTTDIEVVIMVKSDLQSCALKRMPSNISEFKKCCKEDIPKMMWKCDNILQKTFTLS